MVKLICVKYGDLYSNEYVKILKAMVERNTTVPHQFVCLSDTEIEDVPTIQINSGLHGWWNKMLLFSSVIQAEPGGNRVVYLDLDTVIVDNIDWLLKYDGDFAGIENLGIHNKHYENTAAYEGILQSGILAFDLNKTRWIWETFSEHHKKMTQQFPGDGELLDALFRYANPPIHADLLQRLYSGQISSYKYQCYENGGPMPGNSIVCFHGEPRPHQAFTQSTFPWGVEFKPQQWVGNYWKM